MMQIQIAGRFLLFTSSLESVDSCLGLMNSAVEEGDVSACSRDSLVRFDRLLVFLTICDCFGCYLLRALSSKFQGVNRPLDIVNDPQAFFEFSGHAGKSSRI